MTPKNRNRLIVIMVLAVPVAVFIGSIFYNAFKVPPAPVLPNPNGYDDLVKAATMLSPNIGNYTNWDMSGLQAIVSMDAKGLQLARAGLQKQCGVPLDYNPASPAMMTRFDDVKRLRSGFAAEGDLAKRQGHPDEAAKSYLDIIHLANESARGGVIIDMAVEIAIERTGTDELQQLTPQLDAKTCRETAAALETLDAQRQPCEDALQQEQAWSQRAFPGIWHEFERMMEYKEIQKLNQAAERRYEEQQTRTRQLIIELAARAYQLDTGHAPAAVSDLVTNYLEAIPIDPTTGTNMVYLPPQ